MDKSDPSEPSDVGKQQLLTVKEVAALLRLSRTQVYALLTHNEFASIKIGRSRRVLMASVEGFIARLQQTDVSAAGDTNGMCDAPEHWPQGLGRYVAEQRAPRPPHPSRPSHPSGRHS